MSILTFYAHDALSTLAGTLPSSSQSASTPDQTASGATTARSMDGVLGAGQIGSSIADLAIASSMNIFMRTFCSRPLAPQTIPTQAITFACGLQSSSTDGNPGIFTTLYVWRPSTGTLVGRITDSHAGGNIGATTSEVAASFAVTSGQTTAQTSIARDILVWELWISPSHLIASSYTETAWYDGATPGSASDNAASITFATGIEMLDESVFKPSIMRLRNPRNIH